MLRYVLILSLLAAMGSVLAAPPRFGFSANTPEKTPSAEQKAPANQPEMTGGAAVALTAEADKSTPGKAQPNKPEKSNQQDKSRKQAKKKPANQFWFNGRRKAPVAKEQTTKPVDDLVTTSKFHQQPDQVIRSADLHRFQSGYHSHWKASTSKVLCSLKQQIPHYGYVEFRQGVAQPLEFALYVNQPPAGIGTAHVRSEPPHWQHFVRAKDLGVMEVEPGKQAVTMSSNWSRRLMMEMSEGMQPVLRYWDAADATDDIEIILSAVNFQEGLGLFNRCLGQVLKYDFAKVQRTVINFHEDSSRLRARARKQLDSIIDTVKTDPGIKQIDIEIYSKSRGLVRYNFRLATRRARAVRDYLMKRGIGEDRLVIQVHTKTPAEIKRLGYRTTDIHIVLRRKVSH